MDYCRALRCKSKSKAITYHLIETIALNSDNPAFRTARFRLALVAYRRWGIRPPRPTSWTIRDAVYFARHSFLTYQSLKQCSE